MAQRTDSRISAELADFDPERVTPAKLEQLFSVAVADTAATSDAAPADIAPELQLLKERWRAQQQAFADVGYVFADAPAQVMDLVGEDQKAFDAVTQYNHDRCGLGHDQDANPDHSHEEG